MFDGLAIEAPIAYMNVFAETVVAKHNTKHEGRIKTKLAHCISKNVLF